MQAFCSSQAFNLVPVNGALTFLFSYVFLLLLFMVPLCLGQPLVLHSLCSICIQQVMIEKSRMVALFAFFVFAFISLLWENLGLSFLLVISQHTRCTKEQRGKSGKGKKVLRMSVGLLCSLIILFCYDLVPFLFSAKPLW